MTERPTPYYEDDLVTLYHGDCLDVLRSLPDASVDAVVTDPPYGLEFMGKEWDGADGFRRSLNPNDAGRDNAFGRTSRTSPEYRTDSAFQEWCEAWARECLRVLKPGGHMLAFGGSRTWHRLACAVEDAGFEIRDSIAWLYGSGFPKSLDVSKAIDRQRKDDPAWRIVGQWLKGHREAAGYVTRAEFAPLILDGHKNLESAAANLSNWENGLSFPTWERWLSLKGILSLPDDMDAEVWRLNGRKGKPGDNFESREVLSEVVREVKGGSWADNAATGRYSLGEKVIRDTAPATPDAERWQGWGSAMKPAFEPVVVARKPLIGTIAQNVLTHGTGALNIDGCRINASDQRPESPTSQGVARSSRGDSTTCTCPELEGDQSSHTLSTSRPETSVASRAGRSDLPASAPRGESGRPQPLGSPAGCQSSPRSGDAPVREARADAPASPQLSPDADTSRDRCASCGRNRLTPSMPCPDSTTPHVQRTGRWPANVILDESQAAALDEQSGETASSARPRHNTAEAHNRTASMGGTNADWTTGGHDDQGGASRFFYVAKADSAERVRVNGVAHPTVKPLALMRWLVRLVTPPGGTVLEPFAGSGTTVEACLLEGFKCIAIEREADYLPLIQQRIDRRLNPVAAIRSQGEEGGLFDLLNEETA